ncbi:hypothetical protein B2G71_02205 [Novosphingobium sp. PC22D]|nr:hypothetical protein B2G71_02205 [Novosphingobium sp. PC22D]
MGDRAHIEDFLRRHGVLEETEALPLVNSGRRDACADKPFAWALRDRLKPRTIEFLHQKNMLDYRLLEYISGYLASH